jgi:hypothetical protein
MNIYFNKTKEMVIGSLSNSPPPVISIHGNIIERVSSFKLLRVTLDSKLKRHGHGDFIINKATSRLYALKQRRRNHVNEDDLFAFYTAMICYRPCLPGVALQFNKRAESSMVM